MAKSKGKKVSIIELGTDELLEKLNDSKVLLRKSRFAHAVSALENPSQLKVMRKDIARLNTELTKRSNAAKTAK